MLNRSGVNKNSYSAPTQILANVEMQYSVGAIVDSALGTDVEGSTIAKAGTPVVIDTLNAKTPVMAPSEGAEANGVLLHHVDVSKGNANGTVLLFGSVNLNRVDDDVATLLETAGSPIGQVILVRR